MKCLERNKTSFEFLPYVGLGLDLNEFGEHTGDYEKREYGEPIPYRGNISTPSGRENQLFYGEDIRYTHTLVMDNPNVAINEYGVIRWKNELYDVLSVRPSINFISFALRKQTVDHSEEEEPAAPDDPEDTEGEG